MEKTIAVLGATGSVGLQALDVARARGIYVDLLTANRDSVALEALVREFKPRYAVMADGAAARDLRVRLSDTDTRVLSGSEGILEAIALTSSKTVVNSILGGAGLLPSLAVIDRGLRLALANKESLVIAGDEVMERAKKTGAEIIPVDSEHCAIFQSLKSGRQQEVKSLILTASGGPFYGYTQEMLKEVTLADTLAHPTWKMGKKITVDSATLMNKGFEIIEAKHLFGIDVEKIRVVVHRESILHSAVEYIDNSIVGELSVPDMRMCVQYAIDYPARENTVSEPLDLCKIGKLTLFEPDYTAFPFLNLAKSAIKMGGACPAVMNAADEVAVQGFLSGRLSFVGIMDKVSEVCQKMFPTARGICDVDGIMALDKEARELTRSLIG